MCEKEEEMVLAPLTPMVTPALASELDIPSVLVDPRPIVEYVLEALYEGFAEYSDDVAEFI